ncbi:hypothetical protein B0T19DRAFT_273521 [Cercophora scortea]|uniref:Cytochrome b5 heme-binding domain-containing protein n=1 Tax=Cercophora scortea TaxID=314031 RepID=A0AAE0I825_9PEZI|nr:hypothetical protein B0T19DRAFT_273521 [Cercophora scortea]
MSSSDGSSTTPHKGPDSPWRSRYGGWNEPAFVNSGHSGLRPVKPSIKRPLGQGEDLDELVRNGPFPEPDEHDLDYIFSTERFQARHNMGVKSWQLGSFNSFLPVNTTLQVDPEHWHEPFKTHHWFDYEAPITPDRPEGTWSIDDPWLWAELSICIEVANRIYTQLLRTRWLQGLLIHPPEKIIDAGFRVSPGHPASQPWRTNTRASGNTPMTNEELDEVSSASNKLASRIVWTFFDKECPDRYGVPNHSMGLATAFTQHVTAGPREPFVAIFLSNDMLRTLMHDFRRTHAGIAERYIGRFHLAVTMVHQLMHAFWMLRVRDGSHDQYGTNLEPFVNDEWVIELGYSFENEIFGGVINVAPQCNGYEFGEPEEPGRRSYLLGLTKFPEDSMYATGMVTMNRYEHYGGFRRGLRFPVPTLYAALFQQEQFWTTIVPNFGISVLKAPSYFQTRVSHLNDLELRTYSVKEIRHQGGSNSSPHLHYSFSRIMMDFKKRTATWDAIRPWYKPAYAIWQLTPYAIADLRTPVEMFYNAAQLRDLKLAIELRDGLELRLITYTNSDKEVLGSLYLYQIFYLLMTVTMPWKPQRYEYQHGSTEPRSLENRWKPSRDALNMGIPLQFPDIWEGPADAEYRWHRGYSMPSQFKMETAYEGRMTILRNVKNLAHMWWSQLPVHGALYTDIIVTVNKLKNQIDSYNYQGNDYAGWLNWDFEFPPYNSRSMRYTTEESDPTAGPGDDQIFDPRGYYPSPLQTPARRESNPKLPSLFQGLTIKDRNDGLNTPPATARTISASPAPDRSGYEQGYSVSVRPGGLYYKVKEMLKNATEIYSHLPKNQWGKRKEKRRIPKEPPRVESPRQPSGQLKHWTIGQVADCRTTKAYWVVVDDGKSGYDVYDISERVHEPWGDYLLQEIRKTRRGLEISRDTLERYFQNEDDPQADKRFRGKLLIPRRLPDILEHDGREGRPLWITIGTKVYDITNFPFENEEEKKALLDAPPGAAALDAFYEDVNTNSLSRRLQAYQCATVRQPMIRHKRKLDVFTMRFLGRYISPGVGLWTVIDANVYDLTDYCPSHPGGENIILQYAGLDATDEFKKSHATWKEYLRDFKHLKLGHVVPERDPSIDADLGEKEILLNGWVYEIGEKLHKNKHTRELYYDLRDQFEPHFKTDITTLFQNDRSARFQPLVNHPELVVAYQPKPLGPKHRGITIDELQEHNELLRPRFPGPPQDFAFDPLDPGAEITDEMRDWWITGGGTARDMWVRVDDMVYDVSGELQCLLFPFSIPVCSSTLRLPFLSAMKGLLPGDVELSSPGTDRGTNYEIINFTDIMEHGPHIDPQLKTKLKACGGAECTDEDMRFNLQHMNIAPVMGRLVREERKPKRKRADVEVEWEEEIKKKARKSETIERLIGNNVDCGTSQKLVIDSMLADQQD